MRLRRAIEWLIFSKMTVGIYMFTVALLMLYSPTDTGIQNPLGMGEIGDYIAHFLVFMPFMICGDIIWGLRLRVGLWFLVGTLFVILLESCQYFLPYRGFNIYDMIVGELGLGCSYLLMKLLRGYRAKKIELSES